MVDGPRRQLTGTVTTQVTRYNRFAVPLAVVVALCVGFLMSLPTPTWQTWVVGPLAFVVIFAVTFVSKRREARYVVDDLRRIAVLAVDQTPDRTGIRRFF